MAQSLSVRPGILKMAVNHNLSTVEAAVTSKLIERLLKDVSDALDVSDLAEAIGASRDQTLAALERLCVSGIIAGPLSWANVNSVQPSMLTVRVQVSEGLPINDDKPKAPKAASKPKRPFGVGTDIAYIGGDEYRGDVAELETGVGTLYALTVERKILGETESARVVEQDFDDAEAAWKFFDEFVGGTEPVFRRDEILPVGEVMYRVEVKEAERFADQGKFSYHVDSPTGSCVFNGVADSLDEAWKAVEGWWRGMVKPVVSSEAPTASSNGQAEAPKKSTRAKKAAKA